MVVSPVGPLPASTYWRRRGVLLAVLLLLLLVLTRCTGGGGSPTASSRGTATPPAGATSSPSPSRTPTATSRPTATPAATASGSPVAAGTCADSVLTLSAGADAPTYAVGTSPLLTLTVRNTGSVPCRRDLGSGAVELLVYSGPDRIWSSDDCTSTKASDPVLLAPGASRAVKLTWSGKRSRPACAGERTSAQPGTYRVVGRAGTLRREGDSFRFS